MPDSIFAVPLISTLDLLDINVWLALADENHAPHVRVPLLGGRICTTNCVYARHDAGIRRLLTNGKVMQGTPFTAQQARDAYRAFRHLPKIIGSAI